MKSKPLIVGCDPSTKHLAFFAGYKGFHWKKYNISDGNKPFAPVVCANAERAARDFIDDLNIGAASPSERIFYIEAPTVARGGLQTTIKQAMVSGAVQAVFVQSGYSVYVIPPSQWKKAVVGNGGADKQDIAQCVAGLWSGSPSLGGDEDLTDAAAVCFYGFKVESRRTNLLA